MTAAEFAERFRKRFHAEPQIFRAPGRVNLIGEHTDYNDGFVLPSAIGFYTHVAISPRSDSRLVLESAEYDNPFEFDLNNLPQKAAQEWCDYVVGVAVMLQRAGHPLSGANMLVHGEIPIGAGLSSSAAIEVSSALALLGMSEARMELPQVARLCQRAENEFVGARVGIMDQFVSCLGQQGHALLLDCRSLDFELVSVPDQVKLVICNTMVKHELAGGEYNRRREECETGVRILAKTYSGIKALRDVSLDQLNANKSVLPDVVYKRCLHVIEENRRVRNAVRCLRAADLKGMGRLMGESHESLRDMYEVSCPELDIMVESAANMPGFYGGRMTGGGFGGCTVNLVDSAEAQTFAHRVTERYKKKIGVTPDVFICEPANGAGVEKNIATLADPKNAVTSISKSN
jgi:galactokinase